MATKAIIGERILRRVYGGDIPASAPVDIRDTYQEIENVWNYLIEKYLNLYGEDVQGEFISVYEDVEVLKNEKRDRLYAKLPAQLTSVRSTRNISGLRQISLLKDEYNVFIPMKTGDAATFSGLEAGSIGGRVAYWLEGSNIIFENMPSGFCGKHLLVKMISAIEDLDPDEQLMIPASVVAELEEEVFRRITGMRQVEEDKIPDNV